MKIVFAASEAVPFCKTGGLADVAGALTQALAQKKHDVSLFLPYYRLIKQTSYKKELVCKNLAVPFGEKKEIVQVWRVALKERLHAYLVDAPPFFDRDGIYGDRPSAEYSDNDARYALFSRAVLEALKALKLKPAILHVHDWQTALIPAYLKTIYKKDAFFSQTASVITIHNMAYQGVFPGRRFYVTGLPEKNFVADELEFYGQVNYLKAGLVYSDAINTVSPTYAKQIASDPIMGWGLEGVLQIRGEHFKGIANGLDVHLWNPATDSHLATTYDEESLSKRALCKKALQEDLGFDVDAKIPLLGFVGRLDPQKGVDVLIDAATTFLQDGAQMVVIGMGHPDYVEALRRLQVRFSSQIHVQTDFAEPLAHEVYGGVDLFLMPSRYEPCGLSQLIAMRYGAIPVVTPTGGLLDTVDDVRGSAYGTGFIARDMTTEAFRETVHAALNVMNNKKVWLAIQKRAMTQDHSWNSSVKSYLELYKSARAWRLS